MKKTISKIDRNILIYLVDMIIIAASYGLTWLMEHISIEGHWRIGQIALSTLFTLVVYTVLMLVFGVNRVIWRYASAKDYLQIFLVSCVSGLIASLIFEVYSHGEFSLLFSAFAVMLSSAMLTLSRITYRELVVLKRNKPYSEEGRRLVIVGAGAAGYRMLDEIKSNRSSRLIPVALVDDDENKLNRSIDNVKVRGKISDIATVCRHVNAQVIYIAIPSATSEQRAVILDECAKTGLPVKILPFLSELGETKDIVSKVRDITPEELLGREPVSLAGENVPDFVSGKRVLITGGGGSIGAELARQIAACSPEKLIIVDFYENTAYELQQELVGKYGADLDLSVHIANVCDGERMEQLFKRERPHIVIHAAAHKHVPLMEEVPDEAVRNNIFGTFSCAQAALSSGVSRFVLISTDKAVNPTNIMGATKRVCEMVVQYFNTVSKGTTFASVRFGNVLGSHGSVIPLFKEQIQRRADVTVTHPEIIRYFMTIPEASQLVLTAGAMAKGGEIFVLDMGKPVKISDLAHKMISLAGLTEGKDIHIRYVGLRPGEKLFEELLMDEEGLKKTASDRIFIGKPIDMDYGLFMDRLDSMHKLVQRADVTGKEVEDVLLEFVPTFKRYVPPEIEFCSNN